MISNVLLPFYGSQCIHINQLHMTYSPQQIHSKMRCVHTLAREKLMLDSRAACSPSACSDASVTNVQPPMLRSLSWWQLCASAMTASSVMLTQRRKYTTCRYLQPAANLTTPGTSTCYVSINWNTHTSSESVGWHL